jgi:hypothetical protein
MSKDDEQVHLTLVLAPTRGTASKVVHRLRHDLHVTRACTCWKVHEVKYGPHTQGHSMYAPHT